MVHMVLPTPDNLGIVFYPEPVLRKQCVRVEAFDDALQAFTARMFELMHEADGIGLAAPQVGVPISLFVCNITGEPGVDDLVCVNPTFKALEGTADLEEGCLSLPEIGVTMRRATRALMAAQDVHGDPFEATGIDLMARVWQHEADHLVGKLIIDKMSDKDELANQRAIRTLEDQYKGNRGI